MLIVIISAACGNSNLKQSTPASELAEIEENTRVNSVIALEEQLNTNCHSPSEPMPAFGTLNVWDRIRHGFELEHPDNKRIKQHLAWFKKHPEYLSRVSERGELYLHHIVQEVENNGLPMEVALLPIIESAFDPFAYSPSRASGMWQFMPRTGKSFGLKQTWWYDGRRDVVASTQAALVYLQQLRKRFDGDWLLALAAYNSGGGTVNRAIRKNREKGLSTDFWSLSLPKETRDYVPKLIALSRLIEEPGRYGIKLSDISNEPYFTSVEVGGQIDLAQAALLAELGMEELYALNPGFNRWATDPEGPHSLLIPTDKAEHFRSRLSKLPPNQRIKWQRHKIKAGETLSHIAQQHKVSVATLKSINKLRNNNIREGKTLLVPQAQAGSSHYASSTDQRLAKKQNSGRRSGKKRVDHTVSSGDNLWSLGRTYGVRPSSIARWNNMVEKDTLRIGQNLVIWTDSSKSSVPEASDQVIRKLSYRVRNGDSLYKIASKFKIGVKDILKWNKINLGKYLQPGQSLVLYVDVKS